MGSSQGKGAAKDSLSHGFELSLLSDNFRFFARLNLHGSGIVKYFAVPGNLAYSCPSSLSNHRCISSIIYFKTLEMRLMHTIAV